MRNASGLRMEKLSRDSLRGSDCNKKQKGSRNNSSLNLLAEFKEHMQDRSRNSSASSLRIKSGKKFIEDANKVKRRVNHAPLPTLKSMAKDNKKLNKLLRVHINLNLAGANSNN